MLHQPITRPAAEVAAEIAAVRAKQARRTPLTRAECREMISDTRIKHGGLGHATPEQMTDYLYAIVSAGQPAKRIEEVRWSDLETPAAYFARKARERASVVRS